MSHNDDAIGLFREQRTAIISRGMRKGCTPVRLGIDDGLTINKAKYVLPFDCCCAVFMGKRK